MEMQKICSAKIAYLEFVNDQLQTELEYIDSLLKMIGFSEGLITIKTVAKEMIREDEFTEE